MTKPCPFCPPPADRQVAESEHGVAFLDGYPVTEGHTLVVPRAHVASLYDLPAEQQTDLWSLVAAVRQSALQGGADAVNVGVNDGRMAGQTVMHAHIHVIPRREGDQPDPRGGVRWVIPEKADYWSTR